MRSVREDVEGNDGGINISSDILALAKSQEELTTWPLALFLRNCKRNVEPWTVASTGFFGYIFSGDVTSPNPKKVVTLKTPVTSSEVRRLPRMINYCPRVIPDFATRTKPLRKFKHRSKSSNWTASIIAPVAAYFDPVKHRSLCGCNPCSLGNQFLADR